MRLHIVLDTNDPETLTAFWTQALGYEVSFSDGPYVGMRPADGSAGPRLFLQRVSEPKSTKNRMHIDLLAEDAEKEAARLTAIGASRLADHREFGVYWITMQDPEGNEFCIEHVPEQA